VSVSLRYDFGKNWQEFVDRRLGEETIRQSQDRIAEFLRVTSLQGLSFLDIGCASGYLMECMVRWCADQGFDLTLIETMPLGDVEEDRTEHYLPLGELKRTLDECFTLVPSLARSGGPARYFDVAELGVRLGLITPISDNFCSGCNRIRVTATGRVYGCLGHERNVELRELLRSGNLAAASAALDALLTAKPERHRFEITAAQPAVERHMSVTGG